MRTFALPLLLASLLPLSPARAAKVRVKDLARVEGMRENLLYGYGLVVGLPGTGDYDRVFFTEQSIASMLARLGMRLRPEDVRTRNVAAVMVTARLPTFTRPGARVDVTVASMGDARSLAGGVLLLTPLEGPDGRVYAVAQGPVETGGYDVRARGSRRVRNMPTSGTIPGGAVVERAVLPELREGKVRLALHRPDVTTAVRMAEAIEAVLGKGSARALDPSTVEVALPSGASTPEEAAEAGGDTSEAGTGEGGEATGAGEERAGQTPEPLDRMRLIARIEGIEVEADQIARVVVSERTGTVVAGAEVRIRPVAIAHGSLSITVRDRPVISQPMPFGQGRTVSTRTAGVEAKEARGPVVGLGATATVGELVDALNLLGATPRDLISILQAMRVAGALDAEIEVL